jgi:GDPmannose 4,6-dehydratase
VAAFGAVGLDWKEYVEIDPKLMRPAEVEYLRGDASKAREKLGWEPTVGFEELIKMMVEADLEAVQKAENGIAFAASLRNGNGNGNGNGAVKAESEHSRTVAAPRSGD